MHDVEFRVGPGYPDVCPPAVDIRTRLAPATPAKAKRAAGTRVAKDKAAAGAKAPAAPKARQRTQAS